MAGTASGVGLPGWRLTRSLVSLPRAPRAVSEDLATIAQPATTGLSVTLLFKSEVVDIAIAPPTTTGRSVPLLLKSQVVDITIALPATTGLLRAPRAVSDNLATIAPPATTGLSVTLLLKSQVVDITIPAPPTEGTIIDQQGESAPRWRSTRLKRPSGYRKPRQPVSQLPSILHFLFPPSHDEFFDIALPHRLYNFQSQGVKWLLQHSPGALLADDMGLGKTVQAILAIRLLFRRRAIAKALVVAPKSVQTSWARHFADWAPELNVLVVAGAPHKRTAMWRDLATQRYHVGVVTYDTLVRDADTATLPHLTFGVLVADEAQFIKNPTTKRHDALTKMPSQRRWGLTGTPLENRVDELHTILSFLDRDLTRRLPVKAATERIMLRRRKTEVLHDLPKLVSHVESIGLGPKQRRVYERAEREGKAELMQGDVSITNVLGLITRLKQICNGVPGENAKLDWLLDYLAVAVALRDKTLVFSQYVETLDQITPTLDRFAPLKYTGSMSGGQRDQAVEAFQTDPHRQAMLMSLRAGGTGLTLTAANRVVHFDSWWNPAVMNQATARTHRIGQTKGVIETTLVTADTVEERIQRILEKKRGLFGEFVDDLSVQGVARMLTEAEVFGLFGLSAPRRSK